MVSRLVSVNLEEQNEAKIYAFWAKMFLYDSESIVILNTPDTQQNIHATFKAQVSSVSVC